MTEYERWVASKGSYHYSPGDREGHLMDYSSLDAAGQFKPYFRGPRIKVTTTYPDGETFTRFGTVGVTTGWRPVFLLMKRSDSVGSSDVLGPDDKVVAVKTGSHYRPVLKSPIDQE